MKKLFIIVLFAVFAISTLTAQVKKPLSGLEQAADDSKYQSGAMFLSLNRYDKALQEFSEYLEIYYNGNHRHEAYKKIAEIYLQSFDYQKAADQYKSLYEEFSSSEDGLEGYFRAGICFQKMGYDDKAKDIFTEIQTNYPESAFARQSQAQLDLMKILSSDGLVSK
jgi:TolA-binding protein